MSQLLELKFAELHNPLFLGGKNLQMKLDPSKLTGLKLAYDRAEKELLVTWNKEVGIIPSSNVACMVVGKIVPREETQHVTTSAPMRSAQVDSPMAHVHAGPGHGKTGK